MSCLVGASGLPGGGRSGLASDVGPVSLRRSPRRDAGSRRALDGAGCERGNLDHELLSGDGTYSQELESLAERPRRGRRATADGSASE
jgi:hypothetical protein